jgi:FKBP-type peptidyl-prolyl cis-trans isomerase SlyD
VRYIFLCQPDRQDTDFARGFTMEIAHKKVVTLNYTLTDNDGNVIDKSSDGSFAYLHGANNIIGGLENALVGKELGDELSVSVAPEEAYGVRNEERMQDVPKTAFPEDAEIVPGTPFHAEGPNGEMIMVTIIKVEGDTVTIDGNHPLAGVHLNFEVKVTDVRDATAEEMEHGHVHGPGGHQHS